MDSIKRLIHTKNGVLTFCVSLAFAIFTYGLLITEGLVNTYDGLWSMYTGYSGEWEVSLGRWMLLIIDRVFRCTNNSVMTPIIALAVFCLGMMLVLDSFDIKNTILGSFISVIALSNTLVCIVMSYTFTAIGYSAAFFFSCMAAWLLIKTPVRKNLLNDNEKWLKWFDVLLSSVCISSMMSCYQAYFGVFCLIILLYAFIVCERDIRFVIIIKTVISVIVAMILYLISLKVSFFIIKTNMSDYHGGSGYSLLNSVKKLPESLVNAYHTFFKYYKGDLFQINYFQKFYLPQILFVAALIIAVVLIIKWKGVKELPMVILAVVLMPIACGMILFIATDAGVSLQMTAPYVMLLPVLLCTVSVFFENSRRYAGGVVLLYVIAGLLFHGNYLMTQVDQISMKQSRNNVEWMFEETVSDLKEAGLLDPEQVYCYYGRPSDNGLYSWSEMMKRANRYTRLGEFWLGDNCATLSWQAVFTSLNGINMKAATPERYDIVRNGEELDMIRRMPCFPQDGYIQKINDIVVVKISETE